MWTRDQGGRMATGAVRDAPVAREFAGRAAANSIPGRNFSPHSPKKQPTAHSRGLLLTPSGRVSNWYAPLVPSELPAIDMKAV